MKALLILFALLLGMTGCSKVRETERDRYGRTPSEVRAADAGAQWERNRVLNILSKERRWQDVRRMQYGVAIVDRVYQRVLEGKE